MTTDNIHAISALLAIASLCGGAYLIAGAGPALCVFGGILLSGVVYARTRAIEIRNRHPDLRSMGDEQE